MVVYDFRNVNLSHIRRNGNKHAYLLVRHAYGIDDYCVWIEERPCFFRTSFSP